MHILSTISKQQEQVGTERKIGQASSKKVKFWLSPTSLKCSNKAKAIPIHYPHLFSPPTHHSQASTTQFLCCPKKLQDALFYYRIQKYIEQKFIFSITWKPTSIC